MTHPLKMYPFPKSQLDRWLQVAAEKADAASPASAEVIDHPFYEGGIFRHPSAAEAWNEWTYELLAEQEIHRDPYVGSLMDTYGELQTNGVNAPVSEATQMVPPASFVVRMELTRRRKTFITAEEAEAMTRDAESFIETLWLSGEKRTSNPNMSNVNGGGAAHIALSTVEGFDGDGWNTIFEWVTGDNDWDMMVAERKALASNPHLPAELKQRFRGMLSESFGEIGDDEFGDNMEYSSYQFFSHLRSMTSEEVEEEGRLIINKFRPRFSDGMIDSYGPNRFLLNVVHEMFMHPQLSPEFALELSRIVTTRVQYQPFVESLPAWNFPPLLFDAWQTACDSEASKPDCLFSAEESVWLTDEQVLALSKVGRARPTTQYEDKYEDSYSIQVWCRPGYPCMVRPEYLTAIRSALEDENPLPQLVKHKASRGDSEAKILPGMSAMVDGVMACACGTEGVSEMRQQVASAIIRTIRSENVYSLDQYATGWLAYIGEVLADMAEKVGQDEDATIPAAWLAELV